VTEPEIRLTNVDRVLWPRTGFTKGDMIEYYLAVAAHLLPHIEDRPMTLARFPEGVEGWGWYQTRCRGPAWLPVREMASRKKPGERVRICLINDVRALVWAVNQGGVELHPYLAPGEDVDRPAVAVFDLDPGPPAGLLECAEVALLVRGLLAELGLESLVKTSGWKGLHVYAPINGPCTYEATKGFTRAVAATLHRARPELVVDVMDKAARPGRVYVDWRQNSVMNSTIAPYSLRARPEPTVSTPLTWDEVSAALAAGDPARLVFGPAAVRQRLEDAGDVFAPVLSLVQALPS
jgi:bifunctional non-homologous end joining protein LigD